MAKGFAYLDRYGVLHVVKDEKTAREYSGGNVEQIDFEYGGGYPVVQIGDKKESIIVETDNGIYEKNGRTIPGYLMDLTKRLLANK